MTKSFKWSIVLEQEPIVETTKGKVKGFNRNQNAVFLGIPYGEDCDSENRFLPSREKSSWSGIRECTSYGAKSIKK